VSARQVGRGGAGHAHDAEHLRTGGDTLRTQNRL
jgi:hypothetical protein